MWTVWWFRPVSRAALVGAQSEVVWNWLYLRPSAATLSSAGDATGPPKVESDPNPTSSSSTMTTFGAPSGAVSSGNGTGVESSVRRATVPA